MEKNQSNIVTAQHIDCADYIKCSKIRKICILGRQPHSTTPNWVTAKK